MTVFGRPFLASCLHYQVFPSPVSSNHVMKHDPISVELYPVRGDNVAGTLSSNSFGHGSSRSRPTSSETIATTSISVPPLSVSEFDILEWGQRLNGPHDSALSAVRLPHDDHSMTPPVSPMQQNVTSIAPSLKYPYMNRWRAAACLIGYFTQGLNDSVVGALLPYMEHQYRISYAVVSLLFIARTLGFLTAGPLTHKLNNRFGRSRTLGLCAASNVVAFVMITSGPPYPLVVLAFYLSGKGPVP